MGAHFQSSRLVLGRSPQDEAIDDLAEEQGWQRVEEGSDDGARHVLWALGPGSSLTYIEDPVSHNAYVVLVSEDREAYDRLLELIDDELMPARKRAPLTSHDETRDPLPRARTLIELGLGAPAEYDEEFFVRIRDGFASPEQWVREAAIWATAYSPWPQYRPLLEAAAQSAPEPKLRTDATTILGGFDVHGV
jgi:hypothetical protein